MGQSSPSGVSFLPSAGLFQVRKLWKDAPNALCNMRPAVVCMDGRVNALYLNSWSEHAVNVSGVIDGLGSLTSLRILSLQNTLAAGDVASLKELPLQKLDLGNTNVHGDIAHLKNCPLEELRIFRTSLVGSIAALEKLPHLTRLHASHSKISGDIGALQGSSIMTDVELSLTHVTGDISAFRQMDRLLVLTLQGTGVTGDISAIRGATSLFLIDGRHTKLSGSLERLKKLNRLQGLYLSNSSISGDLQHLARMTSMLKDGLEVEIKCADTEVSGSIESLTNLKNLAVIDLSHSKVCIVPQNAQRGARGGV